MFTVNADLRVKEANHFSPFLHYPLALWSYSSHGFLYVTNLIS